MATEFTTQLLPWQRFILICEGNTVSCVDHHNYVCEQPVTEICIPWFKKSVKFITDCYYVDMFIYIITTSFNKQRFHIPKINNNESCFPNARQFKAIVNLITHGYQKNKQNNRVSFSGTRRRLSINTAPPWQRPPKRNKKCDVVEKSHEPVKHRGESGTIFRPLKFRIAINEKCR